MSWNLKAFTIVIHTASNLNAFFRAASMLSGLEYWKTHTYSEKEFIRMNNGACIGGTVPVKTGSPAVAVMQALASGEPYESPYFAALRAGNEGNEGLTEAEFNTLQADMVIAFDVDIVDFCEANEDYAITPFDNGSGVPS